MAVKIVNGTSSELAEMLLDHRTDFCLISRRSAMPVWLPIRQDELLVLLPKSHPLAALDAVPVQRMKTEPFIESYPGMELSLIHIFLHQKETSPPPKPMPAGISRRPPCWSAQSASRNAAQENEFEVSF